MANPFGRYSLPNVLGRLFHRTHEGDTPWQWTAPTQAPLPTWGGWSQWSGGIDHTIPGVNTGLPPAAQGNGGNTGIVPPGYQPFDFQIDHTIPGVNVGGGGYTGSHQTYGGGLYTTGTLGGGTVVDPSAWGQFGMGGTAGEQDSTGRKSQFATGMSDGGGNGRLGTLLARRNGGNTGIVPPGWTGGGGQVFG